MLDLLTQNNLFDSHCHLSDKQFDTDRAEVIKDAVAAGVKKIFDVSIDIASFEKSQSYFPEFSDILIPGLGIHPELTIPGSDLYDKSIDEDGLDGRVTQLDSLFTANKMIGMVGECGLDYYWLEKAVTDKKEQDRIKVLQQKLFRFQLDLAVKYKLPVSVHARNAHSQALQILADYADKTTVIMHSFTGNYSQASEILKMGMLIGINGIVTYPSATELLAAVRQIISEKGVKTLKELYAAGIVLETDAPYLAPQDSRGKRNEPAYLQKVAGLLRQS